MSDNTKYQTITLNVSGAAPGQNISIDLSGDGSPIAWSTGPDFQNTSGINVTSLSGDLPLQQFSINASNVSFSTSSSGGGGSSLTFTVKAYLVADNDTNLFYLKSNSDTGVEITAAIGASVPQVVNRSQTTFQWDPV